MNIETGGINVR